MSSLPLIDEVYRAMREKDDSAFLAICADDLVWQQNPGFPGGGTWHGAAAVIENVFRANSRRWRDFAFTVDERFEAPGRVVVLGQYSGTHVESGKSMHAAVAHVYDVRDGKVARFRMFADTKTMWEAMPS